MEQLRGGIPKYKEQEFLIFFFMKKVWGEKMNVIFSDVFSFFLFFSWVGFKKILFCFFSKRKYNNRNLDVFCVVTPIPLVVRSVRSVP